MSWNMAEALSSRRYSRLDLVPIKKQALRCQELCKGTLGYRMIE